MRIIFAALLALLPCFASAQQMPRDAAAFVNSIGVVGTTTPNTALLTLLGAKRVRIGAGVTGATADALIAWGSGGAAIDILQAPCFCDLSAAAMSTWIAQYVAPVISAGVKVVSIEGENEIGYGSPDTFNGVSISSPAGAIAYQAALYVAVQTELGPAAAPVLTFTLGINVDPILYQVPTGNADATAAHCYAAPSVPASVMIDYCMNFLPVAANLPWQITETGMSTVSDSAYGTDTMTQARYDLRVLFYAALKNVAASYLFDLQDYQDAPTSKDFNAHFGLFNVDAKTTPKLIASALRRLIYWLGNETGKVAQQSFSYTFAGLPTDAKVLLLGKPGGAYFVILWRDGVSWGSNGAISLGSVPVTFTLPSSANIAVLDPIVSIAAVQTITAANITVSLGDDPLIFKVTGLSH